MLREELVKLLNEHGVEVVDWRLLGLKGSSECDVVLVEGSVTSSEEAEKLVEVRRKAKFLVAVGSCAVLGGVQAQSLAGERKSEPVKTYVKVDYYVRGCPASPDEVLSFLNRVLKGAPPAKYEARFEQVEKPSLKVSDGVGLLSLDTGKCIVCGRCIEICTRVGVRILNYVYRGIHTLVSTPYGEPFDKSGCIYCGLCATYCPVGAISYSIDLDRISRYAGGTIYVEPEALAALAESENTPVSSILAAIELIGFKKIVVYSNTSEAEPGGIYAKSPAELELARRYAQSSEVSLLKPKVPSDSLYVTQCLAWRRSLKNAVTARELQLFLKSVLRGEPLSAMSSPREASVEYCELPRIRAVHSVHELIELAGVESELPVVLETCPGGCLMGGGQPLSHDHFWRDILDRRQRVLELLMFHG